MQPWHAQNGIVPGQRQRDEVEAVGVRAEDERGGWNEGSSGLLAPISEGDDVLRRQRHGRYVMLCDERIVDEVARGAAVQEDDGGVAGEGAAQLDERARRRRDLVDLREERFDENGRGARQRVWVAELLGAGIMVGIEGQTGLPLGEPVEC